MQTIGYMRASKDGTGLGIEAQREALRAEAERRGWPEPRWIVDNGASGGNTRRAGLAEAREALAAREVAGLMVAKMDRLSRSTLDFAGMLADAEREGWALIALDSPADPTTATGEAMATVLMAFAQLERKRIGERTRDALAVRKAQGVRLGRPRLLPAATVARIGRERGAGRPLRAIAEGLAEDGIPTAHGGRTWYPATVRAVLRSAALDAETAAVRAALPGDGEGRKQRAG
jgi:DNA invertase Pin-like site-specific DNA recombinase